MAGARQRQAGDGWPSRAVPLLPGPERTQRQTITVGGQRIASLRQGQ